MENIIMAKASLKKPVLNSTDKPVKKPAPEKTASSPMTNPPLNGDAALLEFFVAGIQEIYWAENHLVKAIPKMIAAAGDSDLKKALTNHLSITKTHASRLENAFEMLGQKIISRKCDALEGLTMSGEHVIENTIAGTPVRDLGIAMSGIKVENFEAVCYKGLIQLATSLNLPDVADLLNQTMDEELNAGDILTDLSQSFVPATN